MSGPIKMLRTIRLDPSDSFVFDPPAQAGEWAVPGGFMFDGDPGAYTGRQKQAFRAGFLGLGSFGWSTLAVIVVATPEERAAAVEQLAAHLMAAHGAPSLEVARDAAESEIAYAEELSCHPEQTLVALHRTVTKDGQISEQFRTLSKATAAKDAGMPCSAGAFAIVEDETANAAEDDAGVDLATLAAATRSARATP